MVSFSFFLLKKNMNEIIYRGLVLTSQKCKYFQVVEGDIDSIYEDVKSSTLKLTYSPNSTSETLSINLGLKKLGGIMSMLPMGLPKQFPNVIISINGLKLRKLTYDPHVIHIVIVSDSESRVSQDYGHTTIVVSDKDYKNPDFINYVFYSGQLGFLKPVGPKPSCIEIRNFPRIQLNSSNLDLTSDSEVIFTLRRKYDDYVIREIDYQNQVILELRKILNNYGIELVRLNKEQTLTKTSYVTYQFVQTPVRYSHVRYSDRQNLILPHKQPIEFILRSTDMVMFFDFKNKYNNVNLLTNFCEFKTPDKYGQRWTASIKWSGISEEFNHVYQQDDNSNLSWQCQFRCELFFYEVFDDRYEFLKEINQILDQDGIVDEINYGISNN